ncbi:MAG: hypothetical protein KQI35_01320 [Bacteroidetes bacterium]|nr:hypothetical protein [Bacteroidota bacterium]
MKLKIYCLLPIGPLVCSTRNSKESTDSFLAGTSELIEVLIDRGTSNGTYQPEKSNIMMIFKADGTVTSKGDVYLIFVETEIPSKGTYTLVDSTNQFSTFSD